MLGMDFATVTAAVLFANLITVSLLWQLRKLDVEKPPMKNMLATLFIFLVVFLIGLGAADSVPVAP